MITFVLPFFGTNPTTNFITMDSNDHHFHSKSHKIIATRRKEYSNGYVFQLILNVQLANYNITIIFAEELQLHYDDSLWMISATNSRFAIQNTLADSTMFSTNQFLKILRKGTYLATKYLFSHKASTIVTF